MGNEWFETVAVAQRRAQKRLPKSVYWSVVAGSEQGATLKDNVAAFGELGFTPHAGGLPAKRDLATTVLGQPVSMPVIWASIGDLTPGGIVVPPGFTRTLGGDGPVFDTALDEQAVTG